MEGAHHTSSTNGTSLGKNDKKKMMKSTEGHHRHRRENTSSNVSGNSSNYDSDIDHHKKSSSGENEKSPKQKRKYSKMMGSDTMESIQKSSVKKKAPSVMKSSMFDMEPWQITDVDIMNDQNDSTENKMRKICKTMIDGFKTIKQSKEDMAEEIKKSEKIGMLLMMSTRQIFYHQQAKNNVLEVMSWAYGRLLAEEEIYLNEQENHSHDSSSSFFRNIGIDEIKEKMKSMYPDVIEMHQSQIEDDAIHFDVPIGNVSSTSQNSKGSESIIVDHKNDHPNASGMTKPFNNSMMSHPASRTNEDSSMKNNNKKNGNHHELVGDTTMNVPPDSLMDGKNSFSKQQVGTNSSIHQVAPSKFKNVKSISGGGVGVDEIGFYNHHIGEMVQVGGGSRNISTGMDNTKLQSSSTITTNRLFTKDDEKIEHHSSVFGFDDTSSHSFFDLGDLSLDELDLHDVASPPLPSTSSSIMPTENKAHCHDTKSVPSQSCASMDFSIRNGKLLFN